LHAFVQAVPPSAAAYLKHDPSAIDAQPRMKPLLFATVLLVPTFASATPALPESNFVYVIGEATERVPPDKCILHATVLSNGADQMQASVALKRISAEVVATAKSIGVALQDVDGSDVSKSVPYDEKKKSRPEMKRSFHFTLSDVNSCVRLSDQLISTTGVSEFSASFRVSGETSVEAKVLASAIENAKSKARTLAELLGRQLGRAIAISEEPMEAVSSRFGGGPGSRAVPFAPPEIANDGPGYAAPKSIDFTKRVYVLFSLD
jgi:uncharacterized protein YggE